MFFFVVVVIFRSKYLFKDPSIESKEQNLDRNIVNIFLIHQFKHVDLVL